MPAFEFLSYDELMVVAAVGAILVVYNWWDWIRDSFKHTDAAPGEMPRPRRQRLRRLRRQPAERQEHDSRDPLRPA